MDQPINPVFPPKRPAGSVPPKVTPDMFQEHLFDSTTYVLRDYAIKIDERLKSMFKEAFNAGQNFEEWGEPYPDFETWFVQAVERWRDA